MGKVFLLMLLSSVTFYSHGAPYMQKILEEKAVGDGREVSKKGSFSEQIEEVRLHLAALDAIGRANDKYNRTYVGTWLERMEQVQRVYINALGGRGSVSLSEAERFLPDILTNARNARLVLALKEEKSDEGSEREVSEEGTTIVVPPLQSRHHRSGNSYSPDDYTRG